MLSNSEQYNQDQTLSSIEEYLIERIGYESRMHYHEARFFSPSDSEKQSLLSQYGLSFNDKVDIAKMSLRVKTLSPNRARYLVEHKSFSYTIPRVITRNLAPCPCSKPHCVFKKGLKDSSIFFFNYELGFLEQGYEGETFLSTSGKIESFFYLIFASLILFALFFGVLSVF